MERCSSRSLSKQLQAALLSSQADVYLQELGLVANGRKKAVNGEQSHSFQINPPQPIKKKEKVHATPLKRAAEADPILETASASATSKRSKQDVFEAQSSPTETPHTRQDSREKIEESTLLPSKAAKEERNTALRAGAARFEEILQKSQAKVKLGLLERIISAKREKAGRIDVDAGKFREEVIDYSLDVKHRAQAGPPLWSTSLQDMRAADELCPDIEPKKGQVGIKLSRGSIARAVLFDHLAATLRQRIDPGGIVYFDMALLSTKQPPAQPTGQNLDGEIQMRSALEFDGESRSASHHRPHVSVPSASGLTSAPAPQRRSFMERRMARAWVQQKTVGEALPSPAMVLPVTTSIKKVSSVHSIASPSIPHNEEHCIEEARTPIASTQESLRNDVLPLQTAPSAKRRTEVRDTITEGLLEAYRLESPIYVYIAGRCRCDGSNEPNWQCNEESCGALSMLPCKLPSRVEAIGVGWSSIVDVSILIRPQPTVRFYLRLESKEGEQLWWLRATKHEQGWKLPPSPPDLRFAPMPHRPKGLLFAFVCTSCHSAVIRIHWRGWHCVHCNLLTPATTLTSSRDVTWGKMPILTEGPRMDNGRVLAIAPITRTDIKTWSDGIKVVDYKLPSTAFVLPRMPLRDSRTGQTIAQGPLPQESPDSRLYHFLSCGDWRKTCNELLEGLLDPKMPYERILASNGQHQQFFSLALFLTAKSTDHGSPFLPSPTLDVVQHPLAANVLLDAADEVETLISRMNNDTEIVKGSEQKPLYPFSTLTTIVADIKNRLELLPPSSSKQITGADSKRQIAYLHLGSPAAMLISIPRTSSHVTHDAVSSSVMPSTTKNRSSFQPVFSGMVAHGDVVLIRCVGRTNYKIVIESQKLHIGLVFS